MEKPNTKPESERRDLAEAVRAACLRAAQDSGERAGFDGLCAEGILGVVLDAIRTLDLDAVLRAQRPAQSG